MPVPLEFDTENPWVLDIGTWVLRLWRAPLAQFLHPPPTTENFML